jgi:hypothetical protein
MSKFLGYANLNGLGDKTVYKKTYTNEEIMKEVELKIGDEVITNLKSFEMANTEIDDAEKGLAEVTDIKDGYYILTGIGFTAEVPVDSIPEKLQIGQKLHYRMSR